MNYEITFQSISLKGNLRKITEMLERHANSFMQINYKI